MIFDQRLRNVYLTHGQKRQRLTYQCCCALSSTATEKYWAVVVLLVLLFILSWRRYDLTGFCRFLSDLLCTSLIGSPDFRDCGALLVIRRLTCSSSSSRPKPSNSEPFTNPCLGNVWYLEGFIVCKYLTELALRVCHVTLNMEADTLPTANSQKTSVTRVSRKPIENLDSIQDFGFKFRIISQEEGRYTWTNARSKKPSMTSFLTNWKRIRIRTVPCVDYISPSLTQLRRGAFFSMIIDMATTVLQ